MYDEYLNIYADRGNMLVVQRRGTDHGVAVSVIGMGIDETFDPDSVDLIYVGGGQDRDQRLIADRMASDRVAAPLHAALERGVPLLAVCGGYQLLGRGYLDTGGTRQPGVGVFPADTQAGDTRLIGNISIRATLPAVGARPEWTGVVAGFENHAGRTILDDGTTPLGTVIDGCGNDGRSGSEGCVVGRAIGTYLHGPLLPRNRQLTDWLIAAALDSRYGDDAPVLHDTPSPFQELALQASVQRAAAERQRPFSAGRPARRRRG